MFMPVLKKDESYRIMYNLLLGEVKEVEEAIMQYRITGSPKHRDELVGEIWDVIQICIGLLDKAEKEGANIEDSNMKHLMKLINRQKWVFEKMIKAEVI